MIELVDGFWIDPVDVKVVKAISKKKCALWVSGQSAMDGFVLDYSAEDVVDFIHNAVFDDFDEDEDEDDELDEDDDENVSAYDA